MIKFNYHRKLLAYGRGVQVPFGDSRRMAEMINRLLENEASLTRMKQRAYEYGRAMTRPRIGRLYWDVLRARKAFKFTSARPRLSLRKSLRAVDDSRKAPAKVLPRANYLKASCF